jgi:hypothetical protein
LHTALFERFPNVVTGEEEYRFGMFYYIMYVVGIEVGQDGNNDTAVSDGCQIGNTPMGAVLAD